MCKFVDVVWIFDKNKKRIIYRNMIVKRRYKKKYKEYLSRNYK